MDATRTVGYYIYDSAFRDYEMGFASAMAIIMFVIIATITFIQLQMKKKREMN